MLESLQSVTVHPLLIIDVGDSTADTSSQLALDLSPPPTEVMDIVPSSQLTSGMFDSCVCTHNCTLECLPVCFTWCTHLPLE